MNPFPFLPGAPAPAPAAPAPAPQAPAYPPPGYPAAPPGYGPPPGYPAAPAPQQPFYGQQPPQAPMGDFFHGTDNMDPSSRYPWLPANFQGRVRIELTKGIQTQSKGPAYIAEMTIVSSNRPDIIVGGRYSWYQKVTPGQESTAFKSVIAFMLASLGLDGGRHRAFIDARIKPGQNALLNMTAKDGNTVLVGKEVLVQTSAKPLKGQERLLPEQQKTYTLHSWSPTPEGVAAADQMIAAQG